MRDLFRRSIVAAVLALGILFGVASPPAQAAPADRTMPLVHTVQYYGPGPGYYRGPRGYYGRPNYGRRFYQPGPRFYGRPAYRPYYGRRFYR